MQVLCHAFRLFLAAGFSLGLARLAAQTAAPATEKVVELETVEIIGTKSEIATSAATGTKTSTPLSETPQTISVVTRAEIDLRNAKSVGEALRYTAGVSTDDTNGDDPRGFSWVKIRGFEVAFTSQFLDGLRLANNEFTEAFGLEQIEVVKGPGSVLYGRSTPGGLINSRSKRPVDKTFGEVGVEVGSDQSFETTLDTGAAIASDGSVSYRLTALFRDNNKDSNGYDVDARRVYVAPAVTFNLSDATTLTVLASYFHGESSQVPGFVSGPAGERTDVYCNNPNWDFAKNDIYRLGYELEHRATPDLIFRQNARFSRFDVLARYLNIVGYTVPPVLDQTAAFNGMQARSFSADHQVEFNHTGDRLDQTLLGGVDFAWSKAENLSLEGVGPSLDISNPVYLPVAAPTTLIQDDKQTIRQVGLYAQDQLKFDNAWIATLSARYDWVANKVEDNLAGGARTRQDDEALSTRVGFAYAASNGLTPYASYSTSFFPTTRTDFSGNAFDPTEGEQFEIGLKYAPKAINGTVTLSLFDLTQSNVLTNDLAHPGFSVQTGEVRSRGVELESKLALTANLDLLVSASYADVEITSSNAGDEGNRPRLTPATLASAWLDYTFRDGSVKGLTLGGGVRYIGNTYADNANTYKNADFVNFDLATRYVRGAWAYSVNLNNVFDKVIVSSDGSTFAESVGRTVRASVAYSW